MKIVLETGRRNRSDPDGGYYCRTDFLEYKSKKSFEEDFWKAVQKTVDSGTFLEHPNTIRIGEDETTVFNCNHMFYTTANLSRYLEKCEKTKKFYDAKTKCYIIFYEDIDVETMNAWHENKKFSPIIEHY